MPESPFCAEQFTPTAWASSQDKARWANAMACWIERGFPKSGWRKGLYDPLHQHMYGHIAHYTLHGFYDEWFADLRRQVGWLQYALHGGSFGIRGNPAHCWCDVEQAMSTWIQRRDLFGHYQRRYLYEVEAQERVLLAHLLLKYSMAQEEQHAPTQQTVSPVPIPQELARTTSTYRKFKASHPPPYVQFSLFEERG